MVALDVEKFNEMTKFDGVVVIHLSAAWCTPCKAFNAVFDKTAGNHDDVVFASLDTDTQPELGAAFNVKSIPTIAVLRGGALIFTHEGSLSEKALSDVIRQAGEADLEAIRKSVAAAGVAKLGKSGGR
ncbi:hypothetical protein BB31_40320 [Amycolatopsis lurida NRRL 2430]|uniref:Thioredoxin domain-containing protein n=1 Tax=Amycolatopsis lurida NRRL 2430 TaxID=1460371 RepID=A0A2P2FG14_AMYLU|nr:hypothetical protein BB31_40320 [Amycolatopsis lurida NRRL 2430]